MHDVEKLKKEFFVWDSQALVYLDNASTTQMPKTVITAMTEYWQRGRGNPSRGLYAWAEAATVALNSARETVAKFVGAETSQIQFTKGTTESLNLLAQALGSNLSTDDEVVLTVFEHHANLLPWRELSKRHGFAIKYLPMSADGSIDLDVAKNIISSKTKVVAVTHASNVLGSLLPVKELGGLAKAAGAWMLVDAAQTVGRLSIDVKDLACDALAFSGHKLYGPEGIGVLYLSDALREVVKPLMYGGGMVEAVSDTAVTYAQDVRLLEAGSPNVSGAIGLAAACNFLTSIGLADIQRHERSLLELLMSALTALPGVTVLAGQPQFGRVGIVSVLVADVHPHDTAQVLADHGIAVRAGYHCAEPLVRCLHPSGTVRISLGLYNSAKDVEAVAVGLRAVTKLFV